LENLPPAASQKCVGCGHIFTFGARNALHSQSRASQLKQAAPPRNANKQNGGQQPHSWRRNRFSARASPHNKTSQTQQAQDNLQDANPADLMDTSGPHLSSARALNSATISKHEKLLGALNPEEDSQIIALCQAKIHTAKQAIISDKPLEQRIDALQAYIARKEERIVQYQQTIVDTDTLLRETETDVSIKRSQLSALKQEQLQQLAGAPVQVGPSAADAAAISLQQQVASLQQALSAIAQAVSVIPSLPTDVSQMIATIQTSVPATPLPASSEASQVPVTAMLSAAEASDAMQHMPPSEFGAAPAANATVRSSPFPMETFASAHASDQIPGLEDSLGTGLSLEQQARNAASRVCNVATPARGTASALFQAIETSKDPG